MYTLKIVTTEKELKEIFRLRYRVQVEELGRKEHIGSVVDHISKELIDPLDKNSVNMGAYRDGELVGSVRVSFDNSHHFDYYRSTWDMDEFAGPQPEKCCLASRLVVDPKLRHSRVHLLLMLFCFEVAVENNRQFCFIECVDYLKEYYRKFGFQAYTDKLTDAGFGVLERLVFDLRKVDYLREIRSPFISIYETMTSKKSTTYAHAA